MLRVKFVTKNVDVNDPNHKLITDRSEDFSNFTKAMDFIRNLRSRLPSREILIGNPEIAEIA